MWLCVDRIEKNTVILLDDSDTVYSLPSDDYVALVGLPPAESAVLSAEVREGRILAASYDATETAARKEAVQARLNRLFGKK